MEGAETLLDIHHLLYRRVAGAALGHVVDKHFRPVHGSAGYGCVDY